MSEFTRVVSAKYQQMSEDELFVVDAPDLYEKYLEAFPSGTNPMFRTRTVHDCQTCKRFIRNLGPVITINNGTVATVWDVSVGTFEDVVAVKMADYVRSRNVVSVFRSKEKRYGMDHNYDANNERYDHLWGDVSSKHYALDDAAKRGVLNTVAQVLARGLDQIRLGDIQTVLELIESNALYRGEEHKAAILGFKELLKKYREVSEYGLDTLAANRFIWENINNRNARFRNTVIGTLLVDLADNVDLEDAVKSFEQKVAPMNYKRPTAIITQRMVEQAVEKMNTLGIGGAIYRRYARFSDISVNDVLFVDNATAGSMKDGVAALLESSVKPKSVNTDKATPITADEFVKTVLPGAKSVELHLQNKHTGNFVCLTAPKDGAAEQQLFRWNNNYAWSYDGDVTDSVKMRVKAAGGNVDAKLRVSLSWYNFDDLDLHCETPSFDHIYYGNKRGILDVDMNARMGQTRTPVENLAFTALSDGVYKIYVNQFQQRETDNVGFAIEIESGGTLHQYSYPKVLKTKETVQCFSLTVKRGNLDIIDVHGGLVGGSSSSEKWGVKTETLVPVTSIMYSPNHWEGAGGVGAKHLIFALKDCRNPGECRGVYNEFLRPDLEPHRKVFEVLGSKTKCPPSDEQISGVGFTAARGDTVAVVVDGRRSYNITF